MALERAAFAGDEIELRLVLREPDAAYFKLARGQLRWFAAARRNRVELREARLLRLEIDVFVIGQPTERERAGAVNPRVVVLMREHLRLARRGIEQQDPTIFVVG